MKFANFLSKYIRRLAFFLLLIFTLNGYTQTNNKFLGSLPIQNYTIKEYKGDPQVNCVARDSRGILYFGHNNGLSIYNGTKWVSVSVNANSVSSIYISEEDAIYIGSEGLFGELKVNQTGAFYFKSLSEKMDTSIAIGSIFSITPSGDKILFSDYNNLYILDSNNELKIVNGKGKIQETYLVNETLYINIEEKGLYLLDNKNKLSSVEGNTKLKDKDINQVLSYGKDSILIISAENIYISPSKKIDLKKIYIPSFGDESVIFTSGYKLNTKDYYIGIRKNGLIHLNNTEVLEHISTKNGLINNSITSFCKTLDGNVAVTTDNGISLIHHNSSIRYFDKDPFIHGPLESVFGNGEDIIIAGKEGIFKLNQTQKPPFTEIKGVNQQAFSGNYINGIPYLVLYDGVFKLQNGLLTPINKDIAWTVFEYNPEFYIVGAEGEFVVYKKTLEEKWKEYSRTKLKSDAKSFYKDKNGSIWIGTFRGEGGLYRLDPDFNLNTKYNSGDLLFFGTKNLETEGDVYAFGKNGNALFGTRKGVLEYNDETERFSKSQFNGNEKTFSVPLAKFDKRGNLWKINVENISNRKIGYLDSNNIWHGKDFHFVNENMIYSIYPENNDKVWLAGPDGLFLYTYPTTELIPKFNTHFSELKIGDSLIHSGNFKTDKGFSLNQLNSENFVFPYSKKAFTFEFGATNFIDPLRTKYSYLLEGFDEKWSKWSTKYSIKYTNLPEGNYSLRVKSINSSEVKGSETSFNFKITPPWYRTWWFLATLFLLILLSIFALIKQRTATLRKRQVELEMIVKERTVEVIKQKKEAENQRDIATEQKLIVEERNKEITESITYAKRIQEAILPPSRMVKEWLTDSFIYYKPKDIVAGDFYWMEKIMTNTSSGKKTLIFFAAADCTGHGVPGAMVSVVCANALNRSVKEFDLSDPGQVLDKVTELVTEAFDKSDKLIKDGMDIALCALDISTNKIYYSGANNPLYRITSLDQKVEITPKTVSNETHQLVEYKATKQPIGHNEQVVPFKTIAIQLEPGDAIYLFSDGYPDQFGGPKGKKYKYSTFRKTLLAFFPEPMEVQKELLDKEFTNWKGNLEQVDDVCVIGVKINKL